MSDLVSIITPMYNSERFIEKTIKSVINQTYKNWEMLIIDDGSNDLSVSIVKSLAKKDERIKIVGRINNKGAANARNFGINKSSGRFLAFLDSDDIWFSQKLEEQISFMKSNKSALSYSSYQKIDEYDNSFGFVHIKNLKPTYQDLLKTNHIGCLTAMIDIKRTKQKIYMPLIKTRHDHGLWLSILSKGFTASGNPKVLAQYRYRRGSISFNKLKSAYYQWRLYRDIEKLNFFSSFYYMLFWAFNGILKWI